MTQLSARRARTLMLAQSLLVCVAGTYAQTYTLEPIDVPGAVWTGPFGINDAGDITGYFQSGADKRFRGFVWRRDASAPARYIEPPGAQITYSIGINNRGDVVGWFTDSAGKWHGFLHSGDSYTTIDYPNPNTTFTYADGVNDSGDVVGQYGAGAGARGFLWSNGRFTEIHVPGALATRSRGINSRGDVVGYFEDAQRMTHGFLWKKGSSEPLVIDYPGAFQTEVTGINSRGVLAGRYKRSSDPQRSDWHGFVRSTDGQFTPVDVSFPGIEVGYTRVRGISSSGELSGDYYDNVLKTTRGFRGRSPARWARPRVMFVDDDGFDCPGAVTTIQEAVSNASAGATILVCPGLYRGTVKLAGPAHNALELIALGREGEVVLQGDHTLLDGFLLEGVTNTLIRGFTVRGFGTQATTATEWGAGTAIRLHNSHYNTIENNSLINMDGAGVVLSGSGHNTIAGNQTHAEEWLATSGIILEGSASEYNSVCRNALYANQIAGIEIRDAGEGNLVADNLILNSGGAGIDHQNTAATLIVGNRVAYGRGFWGRTPAGSRTGIGMKILNSSSLTVLDNRLYSNGGADLDWDGKGRNDFKANGCTISQAAGPCAP